MLQPLAAVVTTFSVSNGAKPTVTSYGNNLKVDPDNDHRNNSIKWVSDQVGGPGGDYWSDVGFINNTNHYRPWRFFCKGGSRVNGIQMDFRDWANDLMNSKPDKTSSWRGGKGGSGGEPTATLKANWHSPMEFEEGEYIITVTMGLCKHTMHDHNRICYLELRTNRDRGEGTFKCGAPRPNGMTLRKMSQSKSN